MKEISVAVTVTTHCNLRCKYCINDSGEQLADCGEEAREWKSADEVVECLKKISNVRKIKFIKFFGGEPMLQVDIIKEVVRRKKEFSQGGVKFAFTTNAYISFTDDMIDFFKQEQIILNISLDGPRALNNKSRVACDHGDVFSKVVENIERLRAKGVAFAIVAVLDERILEFGYTIEDLAHFLEQYTPIYKIEPSYTIMENTTKNTRPNEKKNMLHLLEMEEKFIDAAFSAIFALKGNEFIYENNVYRTIANMVYGVKKEYVCSAGNLVAFGPGKRAYSCYNLMKDEYLIAPDITTILDSELEKGFEEKSNLLKIHNFSKEYHDVQYYGDYCSKENNFESFAYLYRKKMVDRITQNLAKVKAGSVEHLALLAYIANMRQETYMSNVSE